MAPEGPEETKQTEVPGRRPEVADPQSIVEDPEVHNDPMIVQIREMLDAPPWPLSHLLKSRED
jgi:hypothetical protein